jgi:hypothetical protein
LHRGPARSATATAPGTGWVARWGRGRGAARRGAPRRREVPVGLVEPDCSSPLAGWAAVRPVCALTSAHLTGGDEIPARIAIFPVHTAGGTGDLPTALSRSGVLGGVESVRQCDDPLTWTRSSGTLFVVRHRAALLSGEADMGCTRWRVFQHRLACGWAGIIAARRSCGGSVVAPRVSAVVTALLSVAVQI